MSFRFLSASVQEDPYEIKLFTSSSTSIGKSRLSQFLFSLMFPLIQKICSTHAPITRLQISSVLLTSTNFSLKKRPFSMSKGTFNYIPCGRLYKIIFFLNFCKAAIVLKGCHHVWLKFVCRIGNNI